ncbi:MAG: RNA polymerase sigma factor [Hoylesella marshii]|uniref:RNA polymerase sigma factor n=1 Tax=Hoylesella marshii TaxID=189722 RepID=UPI0028D49879|nr:sigma-70 family RNA polymerase sigma factor [Hoylesella marshii]
MQQEEFEQWAPTLHRKAIEVSRGYGLSREDADDMAQDVMLKLWTMRADMSHFHSPVALTAAIAKHAVIDFLRKQRPTTAEESLLATVANASSPADELEDRENQLWLEHRMRTLPNTEHTLLYMRQVEQRSTEEMSRLLGLSPASVRTILSRARTRLLNDIREHLNP